MARLSAALYAFIALASTAVVGNAFPTDWYSSLAGRSPEELAQIIPALQVRSAVAPPGPQTDTTAKLVNDPAHPWQPLSAGDIRGPCPGLNTLASHGVSIIGQF
jgi:hypothetical protein